jgi:Fe-S cluster biogenesis protein NfuA
MDGSDLELLDIDDGVVRLRFHGACGSCPSSIVSLVMLVEQELRGKVPEVEYLEVVP